MRGLKKKRKRGKKVHIYIYTFTLHILNYALVLHKNNVKGKNKIIKNVLIY